MAIVTRMAALHAQKEASARRRIPLSEVARDTGLSRQTITMWYEGRVKTFYPDVLTALCTYYECALSDLLVIVDGAEPGQMLGAKAS